MYSRDVMGEKLEKMSLFSVVTKISTHGDTLKNQASTFWIHFSYLKIYADYKYKSQIAKIDDNKGVLVNFQEKSTLKNEFSERKKLI